MKANPILLQRKYAHVINAISQHLQIDKRQAMDVFYQSQTYQEMRIGISDMHCRSDKYLAEEISLERIGKNAILPQNDK